MPYLSIGKMTANFIEKAKLFLSSLKFQEKLLALYILSFIYYTGSPFSIGSKKILYTDLIFSILIIVFLWKIIRNKNRLVINFKEPLTAMVILFMVSLLNSVDLKESALELSGLIYLILLMVISVAVIDSRHKLDIFLRIWLFSAAMVSLLGLFAFSLAVINKELAHSPFLFYTTIESMAHHFPRIQSTFNNPNMLCTYLHVSLVFSFILLFWEKAPKRKRLIIVCMAILLVAAFFTGSRRFTGLLLSIFLILKWYAKTSPALLLKRFVFCALLVFFVLTIITSIWVIFPISVTKDNSAMTIGVKINYAYSLHFILPVAATNMIKEHPFIGVGFGTYNKHFGKYVDWHRLESRFGFEAYPDALKLVKKKTLVFDPHSAFLGVLAETGVVGFIGLLFFFWAYFKALLKNVKRYGLEQNGGFVSRCILAGFIGYIAIGFFTDILSMRHFWFLMAVGVISNDND